MKISYVFFLITLTVGFLLSGIFIGSMTGQAIRGEITGISIAETAIFFVVSLLVLQVIIVLFTKFKEVKKEKNTNIQEIIKEAQ